MGKKQAVVVGGSNGIGLAITRELMQEDYHVNVLDICPPKENDLLVNNGSYEFFSCDVLNLDDKLLETLSEDKDVNLLMITAGVGRVADFEYLHPVEIEKLLKINTIAAIKIIRLFYERIKSQDTYYCGVMGSIAGWVSSPMFSVYAASKAALCRFVESVNVEIEISGSTNRILNVSPGSIKGTRFNGGDNDLSKTEELAHKIVGKLLNSEELFIPEFDEVYAGVLERYQKDPHAFGMSSYQYKKESGRVHNERRVKVGYLSGTFDLFHVGHLKLLERAKKQCDYLIVGIHPDASHKGKETFIPFEDRKAIVGACKFVDRVVQSCPEDDEAWNLWHYDRLFVGSDYKGSERFARYERFFADKDVEIMYFPYTKGTSSTQIRKMVLLKTKDIDVK